MRRGAIAAGKSTLSFKTTRFDRAGFRQMRSKFFHLFPLRRGSHDPVMQSAAENGENNAIDNYAEYKGTQHFADLTHSKHIEDERCPSTQPYWIGCRYQRKAAIAQAENNA